KIHTRGFDVDDDFARTAHRLCEWSKCQRLQVAAFTRFEPQRHCRIKGALDSRPSPVESLDVTSLAPKRDFTLGILAQELSPQKGYVGIGRCRWQVDAATNVIRIFVKYHPYQTDGRRLRHARWFNIAPGGLGTARDRVDTDS